MRAIELKRHVSGRAYVRHLGKCIYFGPFGSEEAARRFNEWKNRLELEENDPEQVTLAILAAKFMVHAQEHYRKDGCITGEVSNFRHAIRDAARLFGKDRVLDFGPRKLKAVRDQMIADGLARNTINDRIRRIRHVFKWGVSEQIVPPSVLVGLQAVSGLQSGRTAAKETEPIGPVPEDRIQAIQPFVSRQIWGMICFMKLTGARPGEAATIRWCEIDAEGSVWIYRPSRHKTQHKGRKRLIAIGPEAQRVLNEFPGKDTDYVFRPQESLNEFVTQSYALKATRRKVGNHYSLNSLPSAIKIACEKAFNCPAELRTLAVCKKIAGESDAAFDARRKRASEWRAKNCWHLNQLRHNAATAMRQRGGVEVAQVALGHASVKTTEIYAEMNIEAAIEYAQKFG